MALISIQGKRNNSVFTDEVTRKKIDLHLSDINDKITEKDIENVKTDVTPTSYPDASAEAEDIVDTMEEKIINDDGNNSNSIETSWNVLK